MKPTFTKTIISALRILLFLSIIVLLASCKGTPEKAPPKRPNILFAFADDWGKYAGCYAAVDGPNSINAIVKTPNIDRIAREGALFTKAFVNAPSCTPCRSSLLSGRHFYQTGLGAILQGAVWNDSIPTFPLLLEQNGYHIGYTYKVWSPGQPQDAGYGGLENRYQNSAAFNNYSQNVNKQMREEGKTMEAAKEALHEEVRTNFQAFLDARTGDEPFCYWWGPTNVHRKWTYGSGKALWGIEPDELAGKMPAFLPDVDTIREDFADYLGEVTAFDAGLGVILQMLEESDELDNTFIVVSGDHGAPGFSNGKCNLYDFGVQVALAARWPKVIPANRVIEDFVSLPDLAPTFLEAGQAPFPEGLTARSLMPILKSAQSGQIESDRTWVITGRERHVQKARAGYLPYPQRAIRTKDFLYIINFEPDRYPMGDPMVVNDSYRPDIDALTNNTFVAFGDYDASPTKAWLVAHRREAALKPFYQFAFGKRPREELYELESDPDQVNNLADDQAYEEVRIRLNQQLLEELTRTGDPRVNKDTIPFESFPYAGEETEQ